jgi:hypothetical protein
VGFAQQATGCQQASFSEFLTYPINVIISVSLIVDLAYGYLALPQIHNFNLRTLNLTLERTVQNLKRKCSAEGDTAFIAGGRNKILFTSLKAPMILCYGKHSQVVQTVCNFGGVSTRHTLQPLCTGPIALCLTGSANGIL